MKFIGLLMVNGEDDILEETLRLNGEFVDCFYVLDGSQPNEISRTICTAHPKCAGYTHDRELPRPPYPVETVCGYRKWLHDQAVAEHGWDNWFLVLHADEVWTRDPRETVGRAQGYIYRLPCYFPRAGEEWDYNRHPLEQLHWNLRPGYPEFRLFRGGPFVHYSETQRFNTSPSNIRFIGYADDPIKHYPYRSPVQQRLRAEIHERTQFDPDNYRHIIEHDEVYWTDERIASFQAQQHFAELAA